MKAAVSGGDSGGFLAQARATTVSVPNVTGLLIGASRLRTRATTLSRPCSVTASVLTSKGAAAGGGA